jgi:hypothetical protein
MLQKSKPQPAGKNKTIRRTMKLNQGRMIAAISLLLMGGGAKAAVFEYVASLSGPNESPANSSPGTGQAEVFFDDVAQTLRVVVSFSGLESGTTASHIHAPTPQPFSGTAGVATTTPFFPNFPLGVTSGTYDHTLDLTSSSSYNPAFVTAHGGSVAASEAALIAALNSGESYLNIHTDTHPGGEIRGFLALVPETTSTAGLMTIAILALCGFAPRRLRV